MSASDARACAKVQCNIDRPSTIAVGDSSLEAPGAPVGDSDPAAGLDCGLQPSDADSHEERADELFRMATEQRGWRKVVRNFTPS